MLDGGLGSFDGFHDLKQAAAIAVGVDVGVGGGGAGGGGAGGGRIAGGDAGPRP